MLVQTILPFSYWDKHWHLVNNNSVCYIFLCCSCPSPSLDAFLLSREMLFLSDVHAVCSLTSNITSEKFLFHHIFHFHLLLFILVRALITHPKEDFYIYFIFLELFCLLKWHYLRKDFCVILYCLSLNDYIIIYSR